MKPRSLFSDFKSRFEPGARRVPQRSRRLTVSPCSPYRPVSQSVNQSVNGGGGGGGSRALGVWGWGGGGGAGGGDGEGGGLVVGEGGRVLADGEMGSTSPSH